MQTNTNWFFIIQLILLQLSFVFSDKDICVVEDFDGGGAGLFNQNCGQLLPLTVETYAGSNIPEPEGSNGYYLAAPISSRPNGSCIRTLERVHVVAGTEVLIKYHAKGTSTNSCIVYITPTSDLGHISIDKVGSWRNFSLIVTETADINIQIQCVPWDNETLAIDSIIFRNTERCPSPKVCHNEEFGIIDTGIFNKTCTGWTEFTTGSYSHFPFPIPDYSNGYFLSSQQSLVGSCAKTAGNIYMDDRTEIIFRYMIYGYSPFCIIRLLDETEETLAIEIININDNRGWKILSLRLRKAAFVSIIIQCSGSSGAKLVIDYVKVESSIGNCHGPPKVNLL